MIDHDGYLPHDLGIGGGDDCSFSYCLECGKIQGEFPISDNTVYEAVKGDVEDMDVESALEEYHKLDTYVQTGEELADEEHNRYEKLREYLQEEDIID